MTQSYYPIQIVPMYSYEGTRTGRQKVWRHMHDVQGKESSGLNTHLALVINGSNVHRQTTVCFECVP